MLVCLGLMHIILLVITFGLLVLKLHIERTKARCTSNACMVGKTILITGGNSGLGYQTALVLAGRGARIIIADVNDPTESKEKIIQETGNSNIVAKIFDLSSLDSVRKFAKEINDEEHRLDVLINNAGIGYSAQRTADGLAAHMQVNYLGAFLLTHLLIGLLKKSAPSRIIFVSSLLAFTNNLSTDNINKSLYNPIISYGNTKLCNIIASNIFAEKLERTGVTSNSVHPGFVATPIFRNTAKIVPKVIVDIFYSICLNFFGKTVREGAECHLQCTLSKELINVTGQFFLASAPFQQPSAARNKSFAQKIWNISEELVKLKPEEKLLNVYYKSL